MARGYAFVVISLRLLIIAGWAAAITAAIIFLPPLNPTTGGLSELIPPGSPASHAESDASKLFGFPLDASRGRRAAGPAGSADANADPSGPPGPGRGPADTGSAGSALPGGCRGGGGGGTGQGRPPGYAGLTGPASTGPPGGIPGLAGAFPLPNTAGLLTGTTEHSTTIITFLYFRPGTSFGQQTASANEYVRWYLNQPTDHVIGVTGLIPAEYAQSQIIREHLFWVQLFTVLAIALILGLRFRSVGAPLAALACAGTAYVLAVRIVAWTAQRAGISLPPDLDPVLVVLLLGVTTDYSVFFLDGMRARLAEGVPRVRAARLATAEFAPIIVTAGLIVAAATGSLAVARTDLLRAFGPGLALTVLTAMVVSMTLEPALMAVFGGLLFRRVPSRLRRPAGDLRPAARNLRAERARFTAARFAATRAMALLIAAACVVGLVAATWAARDLRLGSPLIRELPASSTAVRASTAAAEGFAPGILSPTEILVIGPGVTRQTAALARLQRELAAAPGVAELAGPASFPAGRGAPASTGTPRVAEPDAGHLGWCRPVRVGREDRPAGRHRDQPRPRIAAGWRRSAVRPGCPACGSRWPARPR